VSVLLGAKAHGLVAAGKDLRYDVSPTLGRDVMVVSEFYPLEHVEVYNVSNGAASPCMPYRARRRDCAKRRRG
jgi:aspartate 1-decarboxylase